MQNEFEIEEIRKIVNYSTNGRGIVRYRVKGSKWGSIKHSIIHKIDKDDEGPHEYSVLPELKALYRSYKRKGMFALFEDDAFMIKPVILEEARVFWYKAPFKNDPMHFIVDLDRTFKDDGRFHYYWAWSKKDMFKAKDNNLKYFTQTKITARVKKLSYQLSIGSCVSLKGLPRLVKIDKSGKEELIKRIIRRPEPPIYESIEMTDDDVICSYFWVDILNPDIGTTYKIEWELKARENKINGLRRPL